jgi:hypothetical protein
LLRLWFFPPRISNGDSLQTAAGMTMKAVLPLVRPRTELKYGNNSSDSSISLQSQKDGIVPE